MYMFLTMDDVDSANIVVNGSHDASADTRCLIDVVAARVAGEASDHPLWAKLRELRDYDASDLRDVLAVLGL